MRPALRELIDVLERETVIVAELLEILQKDQRRIIEHDAEAAEQARLTVIDDFRKALTRAQES